MQSPAPDATQFSEMPLDDWPLVWIDFFLFFFRFFFWNANNSSQFLRSLLTLTGDQIRPPNKIQFLEMSLLQPNSLNHFEFDQSQSPAPWYIRFREMPLNESDPWSSAILSNAANSVWFHEIVPNWFLYPFHVKIWGRH